MVELVHDEREEEEENNEEEVRIVVCVFPDDPVNHSPLTFA